MAGKGGMSWEWCVRLGAVVTTLGHPNNKVPTVPGWEMVGGAPCLSLSLSLCQTSQIQGLKLLWGPTPGWGPASHAEGPPPSERFCLRVTEREKNTS